MKKIWKLKKKSSHATLKRKNTNLQLPHATATTMRWDTYTLPNVDYSDT